MSCKLILQVNLIPHVIDRLPLAYSETQEDGLSLIYIDR